MISDVGAFSQSISIFRLSLLLSSSNGNDSLLFTFTNPSTDGDKHVPICYTCQDVYMDLSLCGCLVLCILLVFCT